MMIWEHKEKDGNIYLKNLLKLLTLILSGGNPQVQKTVYEFFTTDPNCEKFFEKANNLITQQI